MHHFVALKASDLTSGEASDSLYTYAALSAARLHKELGHKQLARQAEQEALDKALLAKDSHLLVLMRVSGEGRKIFKGCRISIPENYHDGP